MKVQMKNKRFPTIMIILAALPFVLIINFIVLFKGIDLIWEVQEYKYYSNEENFVEVTSEINHIVWNHSEQCVTIGLSNVPETFSDNCFDIEEENYKIVFENGGEEYLQLGTSVTIVTAPRYFGDGYIMPIVAIKVGEYELLNYEDGYKGLMESYSIF